MWRECAVEVRRETFRQCRRNPQSILARSMMCKAPESRTNRSSTSTSCSLATATWMNAGLRRSLCSQPASGGQKRWPRSLHRSKVSGNVTKWLKLSKVGRLVQHPGLRRSGSTCLRAESPTDHRQPSNTHGERMCARTSRPNHQPQ